MYCIVHMNDDRMLAAHASCTVACARFVVSAFSERGVIYVCDCGTIDITGIDFQIVDRFCRIRILNQIALYASVCASGDVNYQFTSPEAQTRKLY